MANFTRTSRGGGIPNPVGRRSWLPPGRGVLCVLGSQEAGNLRHPLREAERRRVRGSLRPERKTSRLGPRGDPARKSFFGQGIRRERARARREQGSPQGEN